MARTFYACPCKGKADSYLQGFPYIAWHRQQRFLAPVLLCTVPYFSDHFRLDKSKGRL